MNQKQLFFALVALLVNALFLHIFADNPAMAVTVYIVIASIVSVAENKRQGIIEIRNN